MSKDDQNIIIERVIKFLMYSIAIFCTGGLFFGAYVLYHVVMCDKEIEDSKRKKIQFLNDDKIVSINAIDNLTDNDKKYFYEHPRSYKTIVSDKVVYKIFDEDCVNEDVFISSNPRFKYGGCFDCWWNKPYWEDIVLSRRLHKEQTLDNLHKEINECKNRIKINTIIVDDARIKNDVSLEKEYKKYILDEEKRTKEIEELILYYTNIYKIGEEFIREE